MSSATLIAPVIVGVRLDGGERVVVARGNLMRED